MNKTYKKGLAVLLAANLGIGALCGCSHSDNATVATVGESKITYGVANFYARYMESQYEQYVQQASQTSGNVWQQKAKGSDKTYEEDIKEHLIDSLKEMYILEQHMKDENVSISEEEKKVIKESAKEIVDANNQEAREAFSITQANAEKVLSLMTIQKKMHDKISDGVKVDVTKEALNQKKMCYVEFKFKSNLQTVGNASEAMDAVGNTNNENSVTDSKEVAKEKAENLLNQLQGEETKDSLNSKVEGLGVTAEETTFDSKSTSPSEKVVKEADSLKEGESKLVEDLNSYYVISLESEYDEIATKEKKEQLEDSKKHEATEKKIDKWIKKTDYDLKKSVWNSISFSKVGIETPMAVQAK